MTSKNTGLVSIVEAAEFLAVSPITVRRMVASGDIQGFRVGKKIVRISVEELKAMLVAIPNARSK